MRIVFRLNTDHSKASLFIWKPAANPKDPLLDLRRRAKSKLKLKRKVQKLFTEYGVELVHRLLVELLEKAPDQVVIYVSLGEDFGGSRTKAQKNSKAVSTQSWPNALPSWVHPMQSVVEDVLCRGKFTASNAPDVATLICQFLDIPKFQSTGAAAKNSSATLSTSRAVFELSKKERSQIKKMYQNARQGKTSAIRSGATVEVYEYFLRLQQSLPQPVPPPGFTASNVTQSPALAPLLPLARQEVLDIFALLMTKIDPRLTDAGVPTNLRFTLTTADFNRKGANVNDSPWPMLGWTDERVEHLSQLIQGVASLFKGEVQSCSKPVLNAIVRLYRPGDIIGFHTDRKEYTDEIFGLVLENKHPSRGLLFWNDEKTPPFSLNETAGSCFCLRGPARWDWSHGYAAAELREDSGSGGLVCPSQEGAPALSPTDTVRLSVSFRFFQREDMAPAYDPKNNV